MLSMNEKIKNLRGILNGREVTWDELQRICYGNPSVPCIASLKKYGVLKKRVEEYDVILTEEEWENIDYYDDYYNNFHWDEERELYINESFTVWYSV